MSSNTMRGTPSRGPGDGRGRIPTFNHSPAPGSGIPRPVLEPQRESYAANSEVGGSSTVSASRQKQSKRDEVSALVFASIAMPDGISLLCKQTDR